MLQAIKKEVTVLPGGRIELQAPELKPGTLAEVVIFLSDTKHKHGSLGGLIGRGRGGYATPEQADEFIRRERDGGRAACR